MKKKKIDREFLFSDDSINVYGFRLLTAGYLMDEYTKNPIGYYMHFRDDGVVVRWEDFRKEGDKLFAKPVVNLSNKRGQQTVDEIENGFLNGASVGHIVALEWSEDPAMMLPGQTGPTITKWYNRELSLVDIPGNMNGLALFDAEGNTINLAQFTKTQTKLDMKVITLSAAQLALVPGLKADASQEEFNTHLADLVAKAAKVDKLVTDLATAAADLVAANEKRDKAINDLAAFKTTTEKDTAEKMITEALAAKKLTVELANHLKTAYAGKPTELKPLLDAMKPYESVVPSSNTDAEKTELAALSALTGEELFKTDKFDRLKALSAEVYEAKYTQYFGGKPE